jgi:cyclase
LQEFDAVTGLIDRRSLLRAGAGAVATFSFLRHAEAASSVKIAQTALGDRLTLVSGVGGNVVVLRGPEGLLLVDSGAAAATGKLQSALHGIVRGAKVQTVINTHWHNDHTGGNDVFGKGGAKIIAHAKAAQRMAVDQYVPWEDRYTKARRKEAIPSGVFYLGEQQLKFGDENIEYGYLLEAHTDGDLYVYFRDSNVLVVGDAASPDKDPVIAWYEGGWLGGRVDALAKLLKIGNDQTRIITGTAGVVSRAELKIERDALDTLFTRMSESMRKGMTTEDMQNANILDGLPRKWAGGNQFIYDAHKSMWAHHNKLSHQVV